MCLGAVMPRDTVSPSTLITLIWISSPMYKILLGVLVMASNEHSFLLAPYDHGINCMNSAQNI